MRWFWWVVVCVGCAPTNRREVSRESLETGEQTRLTGFMELLQEEGCAPLCAKGPVPAVSREVVQDEAWLVPGRTESCAELVVRTVADHDVPVSRMRHGCWVDDVPVASWLGMEQVDVVEYEGGESRVLASGLSDFEYAAQHGTTIQQDHVSSEQVLRVIERRVRVCCDAVAESSLGVSLSSPASDELAQGIDFLWLIVE